MIANLNRGEAIIKLDDKPYKLCLTMGSLAKIENAFALNEFSQIEEKFQNLKANDLILLVAILLEGGQNPVEIEYLKTAKVDLGDITRAIINCFSLNLGD
ncbi:MAG: gene transfer agent family protein [Caulobacterales bacterium]|nr:gene transfer agent family protein [Caulobacterales bacterium]